LVSGLYSGLAEENGLFRKFNCALFVGDIFVTRELRKLGWRVVRVWEHELKFPEKVAAKLSRLL
jgi:G:T-mismatch repair DNA endonuclease (very short patch repair protein)